MNKYFGSEQCIEVKNVLLGFKSEIKLKKIILVINDTGNPKNGRTTVV